MTDEQKFTPGPWRVTKSSRTAHFSIRSSEHIVGSAYLSPHKSEKCEANARLIAAAPEMVDLLERTHDFIDDQISPDKELMGNISALLDKINGNGS